MVDPKELLRLRDALDYSHGRTVIAFAQAAHAAIPGLVEQAGLYGETLERADRVENQNDELIKRAEMAEAERDELRELLRGGFCLVTELPPTQNRTEWVRLVQEALGDF